jgi:hypothetical protein
MSFSSKFHGAARVLAVDFRPPNTPKTCEEAGYTNCGIYFWEVVNQVRDTLANIDTVVPNYTSKFIGYELSGLVFFQGFNDVVDLDKQNEYNDNLYHFIRDVRSELNAPDLPFVIGELGMHGDLTTQTATWKPRVQAFRDAQRNATDFTANAELAETAIHVDWETQDPCTTPVLPGADACQCDGYRYYNHADSYYNAGVSMGNTLLEIMSV